MVLQERVNKECVQVSLQIRFTVTQQNKLYILIMNCDPEAIQTDSVPAQSHLHYTYTQHVSINQQHSLFRQQTATLLLLAWLFAG